LLSLNTATSDFSEKTPELWFKLRLAGRRAWTQPLCYADLTCLYLCFDSIEGIFSNTRSTRRASRDQWKSGVPKQYRRCLRKGIEAPMPALISRTSTHQKPTIEETYRRLRVRAQPK